MNLKLNLNTQSIRRSVIDILSSFLVTMLPCSIGFSQTHLSILVYHHVSKTTPPSTSISPEDFRSHLQFMKDNGITVVDLENAVSALQKGLDLPDKAVAITFDDGYESIYETAWPILKEFSAPFSFFISTDPINKSQQGYVTWGQIKEMHSQGVTIGNHTSDHAYLVQKTQNESTSDWKQRAQKSIKKAHADLTKQLGIAPRLFAYPYGEFSQELKEIVGGFDYIALGQHSGATGPLSDWLALPRFPMGGIYSNLETARIKFTSRALPALDIEQWSPIVDTREPTAQLTIDNINISKVGLQATSISCFLGGKEMEVKIRTNSTHTTFSIAARGKSIGRRWNYTCTAPAENNRYFWLSLPYIFLD